MSTRFLLELTFKLFSFPRTHNLSNSNNLSLCKLISLWSFLGQSVCIVSVCDGGVYPRTLTIVQLKENSFLGLLSARKIAQLRAGVHRRHNMGVEHVR